MSNNFELINLHDELSRVMESGEIPTTTCANCDATDVHIVKFIADCKLLYYEKSGRICLLPWQQQLPIDSLSAGQSINFFINNVTLPLQVSLCHRCELTLLRAPALIRRNYVRAIVFIAGVAACFFVPVAIAMGITTGTWLALEAVHFRLRRQDQLNIKRVLSQVAAYKHLFENCTDATFRKEDA